MSNEDEAEGYNADQSEKSGNDDKCKLNKPA